MFEVACAIHTRGWQVTGNGVYFNVLANNDGVLIIETPDEAKIAEMIRLSRDILKNGVERISDADGIVGVQFTLNNVPVLVTRHSSARDIFEQYNYMLNR
jgi:hypothetical protein